MKFFKDFLRGLAVISGALVVLGMLVVGLVNLGLWVAASIEHVFGTSPGDAAGIAIGLCVVVYLAGLYALAQRLE